MLAFEWFDIGVFGVVVPIQMKGGLESEFTRRATLLLRQIVVVLGENVSREIVAFLKGFNADRAAIETGLGVFGHVIVIGIVRLELCWTQLTEEFMGFVIEMVLQLFRARKELLADATAVGPLATTVVDVVPCRTSSTDVPLLTMYASMKNVIHRFVEELSTGVVETAKDRIQAVN